MKNYTLLFMLSLMATSASFCAEAKGLLKQTFTVKTAAAMVTGFKAEGLEVTEQHPFVSIFAGNEMTAQQVLEIITLQQAIEWVSGTNFENEFKDTTDLREALVKHVIPEGIFKKMEQQGIISGQTGFLHTHGAVRNPLQ